MAKFRVSHIEYVQDVALPDPGTLPSAMEVEIGDDDKTDRIADKIELTTGSVVTGFYYEEIAA